MLWYRTYGWQCLLYWWESCGYLCYDIEHIDGSVCYIDESPVVIYVMISNILILLFVIVLFINLSDITMDSVWWLYKLILV
jgi:hypothetical protein